jgi:hypothetical protein
MRAPSAGQETGGTIQTHMRTRFALAFFCAWLACASASANGAYTHIHISQLAREMLEPGPVRDLLSDPALELAYEAGSMFPDSGYAIGDDYGELAHWERFMSAYVAFLRARYAGDFSSSRAREHLAFMLGVGSHGMADQSYDTTLLQRSFEVDGPESEEAPVDQYADYFLVANEGVVFTVDAWAPYADLRAVIADAGHEVDEATLTDGMNRMSGITRVQSDPRIAGNAVWTAWEHYPFLGTHLYNEEAIGSLPWLASLVARYWEVLWRRVHEQDDVDQDLVILTIPGDGAENFPIDRSETLAWARIGIFFGYGVVRDDTTPHISLRDPEGELVPSSFATPYNGQDRSLIFVEPDAPLAYDTVYTVEVDAGVSTISGETSTEPFLFSFRTRCADDRLADCPPLEPALVTGPIPERPRPRDAGPPVTPDAGGVDGGGGCAIGRARSAHALSFVAIALVFAALRRRR